MIADLRMRTGSLRKTERQYAVSFGTWLLFTNLEVLRLAESELLSNPIQLEYDRFSFNCRTPQLRKMLNQSGFDESYHLSI
jgi:hypothetical protein